MLLSSKAKGAFLERNEFSVRLARTSAPGAPMQIESVAEFDLEDAEGLSRAVRGHSVKKKSQASYLHANCGVSPDRRLIYKLALDPKQGLGTGYLDELIHERSEANLEDYDFLLLDPKTGRAIEPNKAGPREVLLCGLPTERISALQDGFIQGGIYPDRLELSSLAGLGAVIDCMRFSGQAAAALVLEVGLATTQAYIVSPSGVEVAHPIGEAIDGMMPIVRNELGLADENAARKMFLSNTFDFTDMAAGLLGKMRKELLSTIGFFEVKTGQSIGELVCMLLPKNLFWLEGAIAKQLGLSVMKPNWQAWLRTHRITIAETLPPTMLGSRSFPLLGLMITSAERHADAD